MRNGRVARAIPLLVILVAVSLLPGARVGAQEIAATLAGRVTDTQGAAMPGVTVTVQNVETNVATLFCGEIDAETAAAIREVMGEDAAIAPASAAVRRAGYLAELALQRSHRGESDDPATLQAIYLPPPAAVGAN